MKMRVLDLADSPLWELSNRSPSPSTESTTDGIATTPVSNNQPYNNIKQAREDWIRRKYMVIGIKENGTASHDGHNNYEKFSVMKKAMRHSWQAGNKVEALKIAIRAAKMMGDYANSDSLNYPALFMHVASVLDEFGKLVYNHIKSAAAASHFAQEGVVVVAPPPPSSASYEDCGVGDYDVGDVFAKNVKITEYRAGEVQKSKQDNSYSYSKINSIMMSQVLFPNDFSTEEHHVCGEAVEKVRNWLYKISCIRELIPRIAVEICLLPCYRFLCNNSASSSTEAAHDLSNTTKRIGMLLRGLGDPLLVVYMQCYLLGVGASVIITPLDGNYARALLQDFFIVFKAKIATQLQITSHLSKGAYIHQYASALDCILFHAGSGASETHLENVLQALCTSSCESLEMLVLIIQNFPPKLICRKCSTILNILECFAAQHQLGSSTVSQITAVGCLGERLLLVSPSSTDSFNDSKVFWHAWQLLLRDPGDVTTHDNDLPPLNIMKDKLEAQGPWLELVPQAITKTDLDDLLRNIISTIWIGKVGQLTIPEQFQDKEEEEACLDALFRVLLRVIHSKAWKENGTLLSQQLLVLMKRNPLQNCDQQRTLELEFITEISSLLSERSSRSILHQGDDDDPWNMLEYARMAVETLGPLSTVKEVNSVKTLCLLIIEATQPFNTTSKFGPVQFLEFLTKFRTIMGKRVYLVAESLSLYAVRIVATSPRKEISSAGIEFIKATFFVIPQPIARLRLAILLSMVALRQGFVVQSFSLLQLAVHSVCLENNRGNNDPRAVLVRHICAFCSALTIAPSHPEKSNFDMVAVLLEMANGWEVARTGVVTIYCAILRLCESRVSGCIPIGGKVIQSLSSCATAANFGEDNTKYAETIQDIVRKMAAHLKYANV